MALTRRLSSRGDGVLMIMPHRCVIGREKTFHEKESCAKRIMPCLLGCGCRMREEQWLEIPDEEMAFDEPRNRHDRGVLKCCGAFHFTRFQE